MRDPLVTALEGLLTREGMLPPGSRVLCALSGGADSVCLLGGLYELREKLGFSLCAAHFDHNLRGEESGRDAAFVRSLIADRFPGVPLYVGQGEVETLARERGQGLEETARQERYAFLRETARQAGCTAIATAHTADDNAETVLLHLARGSGLRGLVGIRPVGDGLIRPLLTTTRREVEAFLERADLPHVEDSTNADDAFSRNRVRHQVVPVLEELYPGFARRLTANAASLGEDEDFLSGLARALSDQAREGPEGLTIPARLLAQAPRPVGLRGVRQLLARLRGGEDTCAAPHLEGVLALCSSLDPSGEVHLPGGLTARREYELLRLCRQEESDPPLEPVPLAMPGVTGAGGWRLECELLPYPGGGQEKFSFWLSRERAGKLLVRQRRTGDRLKPPGRPTKSLKKWLIDENIPRLERDSLPVLDAGGSVAAAAGLGADTAYTPQPGELAWRITIKHH